MKAAPAKSMWSDDMYDAFLYFAMLYPIVVCCIFLCKPMLQEEELALFSASSEMEKSYL